jgi:hypothetical protein
LSYCSSSSSGVRGSSSGGSGNRYLSG